MEVLLPNSLVPYPLSKLLQVNMGVPRGSYNSRHNLTIEMQGVFHKRIFNILTPLPRQRWFAIGRSETL